MDNLNFISNQSPGLTFYSNTGTINDEKQFTKKDLIVDSCRSLKKKSKFDCNFKNQETIPNPFASEKKSEDFYFKSKGFDKDPKYNSNFFFKDVQFFQDFKQKKDSFDSWVTSDSKFLNKLNENFSKPSKYLEQFNDSVIIEKKIN